MTKAIVLGGSRGIGKAISDALKTIEIDVFAASKKDIDTSDLKSVKKFLEKNTQTDILVLNTGGPSPKPFLTITEEDWNLYHNQLFLGFVTVLQNIKINDDGYIFLISSNVIKEPNAKLIISSAYRAAFTEVFKVLLRNIKYRLYCNAVFQNVKKKPYKQYKLVLKKPEIFVKIIVNYLKIKMKITSQLFPKHQKFKIFLKIN